HAVAARGIPVVALHRHAAPPAPRPGIVWTTFEDFECHESSFDALVHVAAVRHRHGVPPEEYGRQNVALTARLLAAAKGCVGRFVDVSSIAVFGWPPELPIDESRPFAPVGPYGRSKVETEQMVRTSGLPYAIVRPSITYGPGDTNGMIDKLFRLVKSGRYRLVGSGSSRVQLIYVEDLAHAIVETALRPGLDGAEFICTYREPITMRALSALVAEVVGRRLPALSVPLGLAWIAGFAFETLEKLGFRFSGDEPPVTREKLQTVSVDRAYNIERMRGLLGWEPPTTYEEGLRRTADALAKALS
ncbi:MAG: NAD-dependent epimerase/dehydratase family protein, partial [Thermoanaerobaculia bacterium]